MLRIGLTGGIGSGKSTASTFLAELGAYILDADSVAKRLLETNETVQNELIAEFGTDILNAEGKIDNKKLARVSFQDEDHQLRLNTVVHPYVFSKIDNQFENITKKQKFNVFVVDGALIYESGLDQHLDYVIVVTSKLKNRLERVLQKGKLTREDFLKRLELQWSDDEKVSMADFVLHNDGSAEELRIQIKDIFSKFV